MCERRKMLEFATLGLEVLMCKQLINPTDAAEPYPFLTLKISKHSLSHSLTLAKSVHNINSVFLLSHCKSVKSDKI